MITNVVRTVIRPAMAIVVEPVNTIVKALVLMIAIRVVKIPVKTFVQSLVLMIAIRVVMTPVKVTAKPPVKVRAAARALPLALERIW